ncbi:MAG TPA: hypothetical protein VIJ55_06030 [Acetobacteraceae bacterium]
MDSPQGHQPEDDAIDGPPTPTRAELETMLDASDADVAAGRTMRLAPVLARMRAAAERIRRERASKDKTVRSHA